MGDEAALEALYQAANGSNWTNQGGWSGSGMSLADNIYGVTVATIDGQLRVTQIDLRHNHLTGNIEVPEIGNLKQLRLFAVYGNSLHSQIPPELMSLTRLEYLYLCVADPYGKLDSMYPHELAQQGGGDVHVGKRKDRENNIFTGAVPAPSNPSAMQLRWFILNWTDSAVGATDGISAVSPELFEITTFVGLQIYDNNGIADLPFPSGIAQMTKLDNLALGVGKSGRDTGWLAGSVPAGFGNLSNLRFLRLGENINLTLNFDVVNPSGMTSMRSFNATKVIMKGSFPSAFLDGSMPKLVSVGLTWPANEGLTGTLSSGSTQMQIVLLNDNNLRGAIPAAFWDNESIINTDFSYNDFTSIGSSDLTALGSHYWKIRNLRWQHNEIQGKWPNLAWGTDQLRDLSRVQFDHNKYVFADMLWKPSNGGGKTIFELYKGLGLTTFSYSPQKPFGQAQTISFSAGSDVTIDNFDVVVTHPANVYQWQKDGADLSGATSRELTITNAQASDAGTYRLVVTNPGVPGLTLTSEPIELVSQ